MNKIQILKEIDCYNYAQFNRFLGYSKIDYQKTDIKIIKKEFKKYRKLMISKRNKGGRPKKHLT